MKDSDKPSLTGNEQAELNSDVSKISPHTLRYLEVLIDSRLHFSVGMEGFAIINPIMSYQDRSIMEIMSTLPMQVN